MIESTPTIQKYMTLSPLRIDAEQSIATAATLMFDYRIRHLPVQRGAELLGIITDRDIKLIQSVSSRDSSEIKVAEAMTDHPYSVAPDAPLEEVVATMAANKYGCAVVRSQQEVVGIFTTVDACVALADLLRARPAADAA